MFELLFPEFKDRLGQSMVSEMDDYFVVERDVPGMDEGDISLSLDGDLLKIEGEDKQRKRLLKETLRLQTVDKENIVATVSKGILTIKIPKRKKKDPIKIPIRS